MLDNTVRGKVTGWILFVGMDETVKLDLEGDFHRDIRGTKIRLQNLDVDTTTSGPCAMPRMKGFSPVQTGKVGDMTAGREPVDYVSHPYIEWYSEQNGRVVLELDPGMVKVIGEPAPHEEEEPVSRERQAKNMRQFLARMSKEIKRMNAERDCEIQKKK